MIDTLYPIFQSWSMRGSVYLISDTHFDDSDRQFMGYDVDENFQIACLKKFCNKNDTLIHLGDVGNPEYLKELKCYKVLIMGNHDQSVEKFKKRVDVIDLDNFSEEEVKDLKRKGKIDFITHEFHRPFVRGYKSNNLFDEVYSGPLWIAEKLVLSHEPIVLTSGVTTEPVAFNIHGHDHSGEYYSDNYHLNLAQNVFGYTPLNLKQFINQGSLKKIKSIHRVTIDHATARKGKFYGN